MKETKSTILRAKADDIMSEKALSIVERIDLLYQITTLINPKTDLFNKTDYYLLKLSNVMSTMHEQLFLLMKDADSVANYLANPDEVIEKLIQESIANVSEA